MTLQVVLSVFSYRLFAFWLKEVVAKFLWLLINNNNYWYTLNLWRKSIIIYMAIAPPHISIFCCICIVTFLKQHQYSSAILYFELNPKAWSQMLVVSTENTATLLFQPRMNELLKKYLIISRSAMVLATGAIRQWWYSRIKELVIYVSTHIYIPSGVSLPQIAIFTGQK